ncbi:hypothetical protein NB535_20460 [Vibrio parahaemolyticus]|uniref:hypothetical protein n=1 Tax=Vibrio parahaemolyticus TaxID=670 RepID=UPI000AA54E7B|nr:hypothetical protein [Vibrio parahaemolyticus]MCS0007286.1 hypothetical protein [Vibrio parahaemolyticus]
MTYKKRLFSAELLLSGPTLLPFALEAIVLIEIIGMAGVVALYSAYSQWLFKHPLTVRACEVATSLDIQPQRVITKPDLRSLPYLFPHYLPINTLLVSAIVTTFFFVCLEHCNDAFNTQLSS